jgi:hypothetical protein
VVSGSKDYRRGRNIQLLFLLSRMRDQDEGERIALVRPEIVSMAAKQKNAGVKFTPAFLP